MNSPPGSAPSSSFSGSSHYVLRCFLSADEKRREEDLTREEGPHETCRVGLHLRVFQKPTILNNSHGCWGRGMLSNRKRGLKHSEGENGKNGKLSLPISSCRTLPGLNEALVRYYRTSLYEIAQDFTAGVRVPGDFPVW